MATTIQLKAYTVEKASRYALLRGHFEGGREREALEMLRDMATAVRGDSGGLVTLDERSFGLIRQDIDYPNPIEVVR